MVLLPTKHKTNPTPSPIKNINTEWPPKAFKFFFHVHSKEATRQSHENTNVFVKIQAHCDITEIYGNLRKPIYDKNMYMNNDVLDDRCLEVMGFIGKGYPVFTYRKLIQYKINKRLQYLIENDMIEQDILDLLLTAEASTKLKPRVIIFHKGEFQLVQKNCPQIYFFTITCPVGFKILSVKCF